MSRWGDEKTLFFISCYRDHECLWNPTSFFYKSKVARENAYASLLEQFNDDHMTVQLLKTKIKNIRTIYHQELNKIRYSKTSGAAQEYKPTLRWFAAVDSFLGETVHIKEPLIAQMTPQTSRKFNNFKRKFLSSSNLDVNASTPTVGKSVQPPTDDQEHTAKKQIRLVTNKLMKRQDDVTASDKSDTRHRLQNTPALNTSGPCEDEFHFFGMNVAAQLRRLPLHTALQLQTEFQSSLYLATVHGRSSPVGDGEVEDMEDPIQTLEETSDSESVEHDVDIKVFSLEDQSAVEVAMASHESHESEETADVF